MYIRSDVYTSYGPNVELHTKIAKVAQHGTRNHLVSFSSRIVGNLFTLKRRLGASPTRRTRGAFFRLLRRACRDARARGAHRRHNLRFQDVKVFVAFGYHAFGYAHTITFILRRALVETLVDNGPYTRTERECG